MDKREYGNKGDMLSIIGFGGIVAKDTTAEEASQRVSFAIDQGINYFDVAPGYGTAEECLGPALEPYRKDVFLACKTGKRDKAGAAEELERSLKRLRTDHFDLYQLHAMRTWEDFDEATGPGGALETFVAAARRRFGAPVDAAPAVALDHNAKFGCQHEAVAVGSEHLPDKTLVVSVAVDVGGVKERDPELEGPLQGRPGLRGVGLAVGGGEAHAAEPD